MEGSLGIASIAKAWKDGWFPKMGASRVSYSAIDTRSMLKPRGRTMERGGLPLQFQVS